MPATRYPLFATLIRRYFYSGWAFLIPYLATYLLYYVTNWPVNPAEATAEKAATSALTPLTPYCSYRFIPSLLHVYWILHAIHLVLSSIALWTWFTERSAVARLRSSASYPLPTTRYSLLITIAPWAILALLLYIPGVYLEWPSDPWEHLRRINEWRILDTVGAHSSWHKSSYFIPYSFLSWCTGLRQLLWLDFYYTGICLLLCWQYYRFSRACGLGERASMVFVIAQALLFGNNIFSFYRYYGISSSIYAQLGAIALTRIVLEWAARGTNLASALQETTTMGNDAGAPLAPKPPPSPRPSRLSPVDSYVYSLPATRYSLLPLSFRPSFWHLPALLLLSSIAFSILPLIVFNHIQGVGIVSLGITAIFFWRLMEWKRSAVWWLIGGMLVANALFLWLYPWSPMVEKHRAEGWLNAWYGFNIMAPDTFAADRMLQILGIFGLANIIIALALILRSRLLSCLTIIPVLLLGLPSIAVPFMEMTFRAGNDSNIVTFQRMLFACPAFLAATSAGRMVFTSFKKYSRIGPLTSVSRLPDHLSARAPIVVLCCTVGILCTTPAGDPGYNRTWHALVRTSDDLSVEHIVSLGQTRPVNAPHWLLSDPATGTILQATYQFRPAYAWRAIATPPASLLPPSVASTSMAPRDGRYLVSPYPTLLFSPASTAATLSQHWPAQQTALSQAGYPEMTTSATGAGATATTNNGPPSIFEFR